MGGRGYLSWLVSVALVVLLLLVCGAYSKPFPLEGDHDDDSYKDGMGMTVDPNSYSTEKKILIGAIAILIALVLVGCGFCCRSICCGATPQTTNIIYHQMPSRSSPSSLPGNLAPIPEAGWAHQNDPPPPYSATTVSIKGTYSN